ncbi:hypothetical protein B0T22DRAFT_440951 [Podospora appendiculata]|uniref:Secreted protein n=1 Tax=Podospora appendiculata TaxID=314037 RepID=A0AAE0XBE1_9PEZI|nr:hypothetical protein B0T22DRAFT_440951 [Podospora appendiculata]
MQFRIVPLTVAFLAAGAIAAPVESAARDITPDTYSTRSKWNAGSAEDKREITPDTYSTRNKWNAGSAEDKREVTPDTYSTRSKWNAGTAEEKREASPEPEPKLDADGNVVDCCYSTRSQRSASEADA